MARHLRAHVSPKLVEQDKELDLVEEVTTADDAVSSDINEEQELTEEEMYDSQDVDDYEPRYDERSRSSTHKTHSSSHGLLAGALGFILGVILTLLVIIARYTLPEWSKDHSVGMGLESSNVPANILKSK